MSKNESDKGSMARRLSFRLLVGVCRALLLGWCLVQFGLMTAHASEYSPGISYPSTKANGMGGAFLAMPQEEWSPFYNPSWIGNQRDVKLSLLNAEAQGTKSWISGEGKFKQDLSKRASLLSSGNGGDFSSSVGAFPHVRLWKFIFGVNYRDRREAWAPSGTGNRLHYEASRDLSYIGGFGLRFFRGLIQIGGVAKYLMRAETPAQLVEDTSLLGVESLSYKSEVRTGRVWTGDAGVSLVFPWAALPTFTAVVRNLGSRHFKQGSVSQAEASSSEAPLDLVEQVDLGFGMSPWLAKKLRLRLSFDYFDVRNDLNVDDQERFHAGMEFAYARSIFLRGGYSHGGPSFGFGVDVKGIKLDFAYYEQRRFDSDLNQEDKSKRYAMSFGVEF